MAVSMITSVIVTIILFLPSRITALWPVRSYLRPKGAVVSRASLPICNNRVSR